MEEPNSLCHWLFCLDPCSVSSSETHQSTVIMHFSTLILALNTKELWSKTDTGSLCHKPNNFQNQIAFKKRLQNKAATETNHPSFYHDGNLVHKGRDAFVNLKPQDTSHHHIHKPWPKYF